MDERLLKLDFGTLRTLQFVHDHGSFTRAAEALGQTQSGVSYTIGRLREVVGDPLFIREGGRTRPTARCTALVEAAVGLLEEVESAVSDQAFDPQRVAATVTVSCNHYERVTVLPGLIRLLRAEAPGLRLRSIAAGAFGEEQVKRGECDLVLGPVPFAGDGLFRRRLRRDRYVLVTDPTHPLAEGPLAPRDLGGVPLVAISFAGRWEPLYAGAFQREGIALDVAIEVAEHGDVGGYVLGTDLAAIVPGRMAERLDPGLTVRALPLEVPISIDMVWTARTHRAPLHQWFREAVAGLETGAR